MRYEVAAMLARGILPIVTYIIALVVTGQADTSGGLNLNLWWRKPELRESVAYESGGIKYVTMEFFTTFFDRAMLELTNKLAAEKQNTASNSALVYGLCVVVGVGIIGASATSFASYRQRQAAAEHRKEQEDKFKAMYNHYTKQQVLLHGDNQMQLSNLGTSRQRPSTLDLSGI